MSLAGTLGDGSSADGPMAVENCLVILGSASAVAADGGGGGLIDWIIAVFVSVLTGPDIDGTRDSVVVSAADVEASWVSEEAGFAILTEGR